MFLVDTNIWLELLLKQEKANEVDVFLSNSNPTDLYISDFTIFSIGIILTKFNEIEVLRDFLQKVVIYSGIVKVGLDENEILKATTDDEFKVLDFDDAYQYFTAQKYELKIVSFDKDFDKTKRGKILPSQINKN